MRFNLTIIGVCLTCIVFSSAMASDAEGLKASQVETGRAQGDWSHYMPDGMLQVARSLVLLQKATYSLSKSIMSMTDLSSFVEMIQESQIRNNALRRNGEDDPMVRADLDWDETKCLYEEYGLGFFWKGGEFAEKYWSKSKRCGDA